jgi:4-carboxymuconolactone decarboxylase
VFLPDPSGHRDVALGLCRSGGRVLLVLNARSAQGTAVRFWDLPGGTVEPGESLKAALAREWEEEVGWRPAIGDLQLVVDGRKRPAPDAPPLYTWRAFVFDVPAPPFGFMPSPGPEIDRVELLREGDALLRLTAPYQDPVRRLLKGEVGRHADVDWIETPAPVAAPPFTPQVRHLLVLAAAAAAGDAGLVASQTAAALADGVPAAHVEEALLQVVPYAGFPRALAAFAAARPALGATGPAVEAPPSSWSADGPAAFGSVYGETSERVRAGLASLHPLLPAWTLEFAYGRVLARPALDLAVRELLAVSILTAMGRADDALLGHMRAAVRLGASRDAVAGAVAVVPASAGAGRRAAARERLERL